MSTFGNVPNAKLKTTIDKSSYHSVGTKEWRAVGVVFEGQPIRIRNLNIWNYAWTRLSEPSGAQDKLTEAQVTEIEAVKGAYIAAATSLQGADGLGSDQHNRLFPSRPQSE